MLEIITYTVLITATLAAVTMMANAFDESSAILAEINQENELDEARRQRMAKVDAEMCKLIRSYGESRIQTLEAMHEIEITHIRNNASK